MKDTTDSHTEVDWVLKDCTQSLDVGEWTARHTYSLSPFTPALKRVGRI